MKCPECIATNQRSMVHDQGSWTTAMGWSPYWDEDGNRHVHNPNTITTGYHCSNGHDWADESKRPCPHPSCDYGKTPAGAADPRDPATTHSRCRRCDGPTQWGWCPVCQPDEFAALP